ncbi:24449_t:CDS:2, partial [Racocetra persica]
KVVEELSISPYTTDSQNKNSFKIKLAGSLTISDFVILKKLYLYDNELAELIINNCPEIELINCAANSLTDVGFLTTLYPEKLTNLHLENNNISEQDLSCFAKFVNLTTLLVGNSDKNKIEQGIYNRFTGNLECLKNLSKLERLSIQNADIDRGLEFLPRSIQEFHLVFTGLMTLKVEEWAEELARQQRKNTSHPKITVWENDLEADNSGSEKETGSVIHLNEIAQESHQLQRIEINPYQ